MRKLLTIHLILIFALTIACWRKSVEDPAPVNGDLVSTLAGITDANQALAIGNDLLENNETEKAIDAFLRATELDPDLAEAWFQLGIAYGLIEKEQQLEAEADANVTSDNTQKASRTNSEKAFKKAIEAYKKILAGNPDDDVALYNMGRAYNKLNQDEEAAKALKQAVRIKPDDTDYQTELGAILIKLAQYREAILPLRKALELDPENSRAADLLDDAEAGRSRIDYVPPKKDANGNLNTNANVIANVSANSNTGLKPTPTVAKPTPKPNLPSPKPTSHLE